MVHTLALRRRDNHLRCRPGSPDSSGRRGEGRPASGETLGAQSREPAPVAGLHPSAVAVTTLALSPLSFSPPPPVLVSFASILSFLPTPALGRARRLPGPLSVCRLSQFASSDGVLDILLAVSRKQPPISTALSFVFDTITAVSSCRDALCPSATTHARRIRVSDSPFTHTTEKMSQAQGDIQERIAAARREAESLKEKIRAKREQSADTSRTCNVFSRPQRSLTICAQSVPWPPRSTLCHVLLCALEGLSVATLPRSTPCIGPPTGGTSSPRRRTES